MKTLHGEKISDEAFQWILIHLSKGQERRFITGWKEGQTGALRLGQGNLYDKGFWYGAHYCSKCETQFDSKDYLSFSFKGDRILRCCTICLAQEKLNG